MARSIVVYLAFVLLIVCSVLSAESPLTNSGTLVFNGQEFRLNPYLQTKNAEYDYETLEFASSITIYPDSSVISFSHSKLSFELSLGRRADLGAEAWQFNIRTRYHTAVQIRDFYLGLDYLGANPQAFYRGPQAIARRDASLNTALIPYTDKAMQIAFADTSLWFVASNYDGCSNVEMLKENAICLYDHTAHLARLYNAPTDQFNIMIDCLYRQPGQSDSWSWLLFTERPVLLTINRWLGKKQAALCITNDADGEADRKLRAVYYGSSLPSSPKYLTTGLVANDIKVTNTVFGASEPLLGYLWQELMDYGNTIGYHSFSNTADSTAATYNSITGTMQQYGVRTWIDHSWVNNPEALCYQGFDPASPYYQLNAINDSQVDYFWLGDNLNVNPFNSFDEPGFLPHRLSAFEGLTRPLWFFGRTKMQTWENKGYSYLVDMKHNLIPENLDALLAAKGLCVVYTHFGFDESATIGAFFDYNSGACEIKDEVNERFEMLNYYQKYRGLWIDTLETIFDRMLAIEKLQISGVSKTKSGELLSVRLTNKSSNNLKDLSIKYHDQEVELQQIEAQNNEEILLSGASIDTPAYPYLVLYYQDKALHLKRKDKVWLSSLNISIYNLRGQKVKTYVSPQPSEHVIVPLENCASGVYFVRMEDTMGMQALRKFCILK